MANHLQTMRAHVVNAAGSSNWIFVAVTDREGYTGLGEAGINGHEDQILTALEGLWRRLEGTVVSPVTAPLPAQPGHPAGLTHAAATCALEQALWDLHGRKLGHPVSVALGGPAPTTVPLYANINRAIRGDRSPNAFATHAAKAVAEGFTAVKCAPFDGLVRESLEERSSRAKVDIALERIGATRDAVGDDVDLMIDCHGRFTARGAAQVLPEIEQFRPYWIEAPVSERDLESWREVRRRTTARLAGGEILVGSGAFDTFIAASGVDVVMPDVRYVGGLQVLRAVAAIADARGVEVAPHNPAGPIATLASAHAMASLPHSLTLEYPWGEVPFRAELTHGPEEILEGSLRLPTGPGWGVDLNTALIERHPRGEFNQTVDVALL